MNNTDFQKLLLTNDTGLVAQLAKGKKKPGAKKERPKGSGKGKDGKNGKDGKGGDPKEGQAPKGPDYRDRAQERREQKGEYETVAQEFESHAEVAVDQSKYLGGDLDHTHLVKGLDFALLHKVRGELHKKQKVIDVKEQRAQQKAGGQKRTFETQLAKRVYHSVVETVHPHHLSFAKRMQNMSKALSLGSRIRGAPSTFLPGRMYYEFDVGEECAETLAKASDVPRTVFTSKEDAPSVDLSKRVAPILASTVQQVAHSLQKVADDRRRRRKERTATGGSETQYASVVQKVAICVPKIKAKDADDDIFAGADKFDAGAVAKEAAAAKEALRNTEDKACSSSSKGQVKTESYFADAGSTKYLEGPDGQIEMSELVVEEGALPREQHDESCPFKPCGTFKGAKKGWVFKLSLQGLGYYHDPVQIMAHQAAKEKKKKVFEQAKKEAASSAGGDAYGECFPESGLGHAGVDTGENDSDEEEDDVKSKIERLKKLASKGGPPGGNEGTDSISANRKDAGKKRLNETQQWQKIDSMIKKGKISTMEELEGRSGGKRRPPAPRELTATPAFF